MLSHKSQLLRRYSVTLLTLWGSWAAWLPRCRRSLDDRTEACPVDTAVRMHDDQLDLEQGLIQRS
jgi:hypothetical protein